MKNQKQQIEDAVKVLQQGGVIAYPTEAVYGLGCDPKNTEAIKKILDLKQRKKEKGLILVAASFEQLKPYLLPLEKNIEEKILSSWQTPGTGPVTWLVPVKKEISEFLRGEFDTLAVRVSHHPVVRKICTVFADAIVSTSANIAQQEAARTAEEVKVIFNDKLEMIIEGETDANLRPSEIRDALTDQVIRSA